MGQTLAFLFLPKNTKEEINSENLAEFLQFLPKNKLNDYHNDLMQYITAHRDPGPGSGLFPVNTTRPSSFGHQGSLLFVVKTEEHGNFLVEIVGELKDAGENKINWVKAMDIQRNLVLDLYWEWLHKYKLFINTLGTNGAGAKELLDTIYDYCQNNEFIKNTFPFLLAKYSGLHKISVQDKLCTEVKSGKGPVIIH